ncbi:MAG: nodulation protein NfeD, partial [Dysgonamonadaceae bacterium]|nr:nodulation protein NfeD [Dysgonamonadaceae bacterium]
MKNSVLSFICLFLLSTSLFGENNNREASNGKTAVIYKINIDSEINTTSRIILKNGLTKADELQADAVLLRLNTYGGTLVDADSMRTAILYNKIPVYVF